MGGWDRNNNGWQENEGEQKQQQHASQKTAVGEEGENRET